MPAIPQMGIGQFIRVSHAFVGQAKSKHQSNIHNSAERQCYNFLSFEFVIISMPNYLRSLHKRFGPFIRFCLVGASGIVVNSAVLWLVTSVFGVYYLYSGIFATLISSSWNCLLTEIWVFGPESKQSPLLRRVVPFFLLNLVALAIRTPIIAWLTESLHIFYLLSNLISLAALLVGRYLAARSWIWPATPRPASASGD